MHVSGLDSSVDSLYKAVGLKTIRETCVHVELMKKSRLETCDSAV